MKQSNTNQRLCFPQQAHSQQGFTLVEIMIAITIGLLMMAGILQISSASKESSRIQRNMSFVQENIRITMELLGRDIRQAGYYEDNDPAARILTPITPFVAATTTDGAGATNDDITMTYESNTDCLGQPTPVAADGNRFAVNHYFIQNQRLMCDGNGGPPKPLVEGVENMQILYGENTDGDSRSANRYVTPEEADLNNVVSVRIALRFISREHVRQSIDNNKYALLDASPVQPAAGDKRMRREVTTTISLRNESRF
jgi:type IV pilus assembly protein PilW